MQLTYGFHVHYVYVSKYIAKLVDVLSSNNIPLKRKRPKSLKSSWVSVLAALAHFETKGFFVPAFPGISFTPEKVYDTSVIVYQSYVFWVYAQVN